MFVNFNSTCGQIGAIGTDNRQPGALPVAGALWGNKFVNTPIANRVRIDPSLPTSSNQYWAVRDADGSTIGAAGYLIANGSTLLMPATKATDGSTGSQCQGQSGWGGYSCRNACYRSVFVQYIEPALQNINPAVGGTVLNLTRAEDSVSQIMAGGNMLPRVRSANGVAVWNRVIYVNLLGGSDYLVGIQGGAGVMPSNVRFGYTDNSTPSSPPCNASARLVFPQGVTAVEHSS